MIFVLDNYDSFTYNLVQLFYRFTNDIKVARNREISAAEVVALNPEAILLSPGPGRPAAAGVMPEVIRLAVDQKIPMLGVCLGHQGLGEFFGAQVVGAAHIMHGKTSVIHHDGKGIFTGIAPDFKAVRYHSLALKRDSIPDCLLVTATADDGEVMGIRHKELPIEGIQYHPESVMTASGARQIENFIKLAKEYHRNNESGK